VIRLRSPRLTRIAVVAGLLMAMAAAIAAQSNTAATAPTRTSGNMPRYPDDARQRGIGGVVTLTAMLDASGRVVDVTAVRAIPTLEAAAVAAVRDWRYTAPGVTSLTIVLLFDASAGSVTEARRIPAQGPQPRKTKQVPAAYPASISGNRPGRVVMDVVVSTTGKVIDMRVQDATSGFEGAAREAVRQWEFEPMVVSGTPVPFVATVTVLISRTATPSGLGQQLPDRAR
jgi:TonB family protein